MCMCKYTRMSKMNVKKEKAVTYDLMIKQRISILLTCFTFLNSARLTCPHQNTQKFTKFTATGEA